MPSITAATGDVIVVGAGIAGASAAALLSEFARIILIEREAQPGYHTTGRSAALFSETYGNLAIRTLSRASRAFFESRAEGMADHPILTPRGWLNYAMPEQAAALEALWTDLSSLNSSVCRLDAKTSVELIPVLRPEQVIGAVYEPGSMDMDVHALHQAYLRRLRRSGGTIVLDAPVEAITREREWTVRTPAGALSAPVVVNAAGAWADEFAGLAGLPPIGLVPKRRTALIVAAPPGMDIHAWPLANNVSEVVYFKPDAGKLFVSPADETPSPACDAQPEEIDVALAVERLEEATTISVRRVERKWAGLRSFVSDKSPVIGFDPLAEGFFWLAGQGGYGIQTAHAAACCVTGLIREGRLPDHLTAMGLDASVLSPARFRASG